MNSAWRRGHNGAHESPIEMRFIDFFMAAIGALIFMAMAFAYLVSGQPTRATDGATAPSNTPERLMLSTKTLPPAQAEQDYELAFAYRGGTPPMRGRIA